MSTFQGQPLQLPELGLHVAPCKVVTAANWAKLTLLVPDSDSEKPEARVRAFKFAGPGAPSRARR